MRYCPDEMQLERFFAGACSASAAWATNAHLRSCIRCQVWLRDARADEALVPHIRRMAAERQMIAAPLALGFCVPPAPAGGPVVWNLKASVSKAIPPAHAST